MPVSRSIATSGLSCYSWAAGKWLVLELPSKSGQLSLFLVSDVRSLINLISTNQTTEAEENYMLQPGACHKTTQSN